MWPFQRNSPDAIRSSQPYWLMRNGIGDARRQTAPGTEDVDIVVVGAGITGALVADALVATGRRIVMLDCREPAQASTAASTALLQYEIDTHLVDLARLMGPERATLAYRAGVSAFAMLEGRFPELLAVSGYERKESLYVAADAAAVQTLRPDILVLDIAMPPVNGLNLGRQIKQLHPGVKVIFLTMNEDPDVAAEAFRAGASAYVLKRSAASELSTAIREVNRGATYITPFVTRGVVKALLGEDVKISHGLTPRQSEVLPLIVRGHSMKKIAAELGMSPRTVAFHKYQMMAQLHIKSTAELIQYAVKHKIV